MLPRLPGHVNHALSAKHPPPYTPHWISSTLPPLKLPPTTSSYLYPLKLQYTVLPVYPKIVVPAFSIYYVPSPDGQDVLSLPLNARYWTVRQRYEERGKKSESIDAGSRGGGGGLWWNVNPFMKNTKSVVRSKLARRMRSAFCNALNEAGFDDNGLRLDGLRSDFGHGDDSKSEGKRLTMGNLTGTLRLNATTESQEASYEDLQSVTRQIVAHLQEIRLHHQSHSKKKAPFIKGRHGIDKMKEQNWREAKAYFMSAMEQMQTLIKRDDIRRDDAFPGVEDFQ